MWPNSQKTVDLVTFTEENLNGKLYFLCRGGIFSFHQYEAFKDDWHITRQKNKDSP